LKERVKNFCTLEISIVKCYIAEENDKF